LSRRNADHCSHVASGACSFGLRPKGAQVREEPTDPVSTRTGSVFLSYASQDADAARRISDALRAAGIEVWLDQSELRGGDAWDRQIRDQIHRCALFIPIISAHSQARLEGYFRREWKFAMERKRDIADEMAFLLPVVIDETPERGAAVPEGFHEVQWTRLPAGAASKELIEHVSRLLTDPKQTAQAFQPDHAPPHTQPTLRATSGSHLRLALLLAGVATAAIAGYIGLDRYVLHEATAPASASSTSATTSAAFSPPPHSLAVLPFVNMSGDQEQEYFSDGLTEEILNSLAQISELQVSARTSSFSFKGENVDLRTIARKLNVGAILEGSVRRSGRTIRITAQLNSAVTGFHLWSRTYDRDLTDVLRLQTEIANAVASALQVTLLGEVGAKIELGGTHDPAALDAYLRGWKLYVDGLGKAHSAEDEQAAIAEYTDAIRRDPKYASAFAARSLAFSDYTGWRATTAASAREGFEKALADGRTAISLAPELGEGHLALAQVYLGTLDFTHASEEFERAVTLAPGNAQVLRGYAVFATAMGRTEAGIAAARRAVLLDPLNRDSHATLNSVLFSARRYDEAMAALQQVLALDPGYSSGYMWMQDYMLGNIQDARAWCEKHPNQYDSQVCLAMVYDKLGRHADAQAELGKLQATMGDAVAFQYAEIYAQWHDIPRALEWLEKALRLRDTGLGYLKNDQLLDPVRNEPRFQAIERALKFPD
jgi:TolB-like protein/Tfp pilus assembly protein PilF